LWATSASDQQHSGTYQQVIFSFIGIDAAVATSLTAPQLLLQLRNYFNRLVPVTPFVTDGCPVYWMKTIAPGPPAQPRPGRMQFEVFEAFEASLPQVCLKRP
jgi:hypothetical protein